MITLNINSNNFEIIFDFGNNNKLPIRKTIDFYIVIKDKHLFIFNNESNPLIVIVFNKYKDIFVNSIKVNNIYELRDKIRELSEVSYSNTITNLPNDYSTKDKQNETQLILTNGTQLTKIIDNNSNILNIYNREKIAHSKVIDVQVGDIDIINNIPIFIDYLHNRVHKGQFFIKDFYGIFNTNVIKNIRLVVPNINIPIGQNTISYCPHFRFEVITGLDTIVQLYENTTFTVGGNIVNPINLERNGTYISKLTIYEDPTINNLGNLIWQGLTISSKTGNGAFTSNNIEIILKNNTQYLFRLTSLENSNKILIKLYYYENS